MGSFGSDEGNVLYVIVCAAPPALETPALVQQLRHAGWDTCVVLTPSAAQWVDVGLLADVSGHPARSEFRGPVDPKFTPLADVVLVAPATFNTINKCVAGISDNLALGLMNEAIGLGVPMAVVPWVNGALAGHPVYDESLRKLGAAGVRIARPNTGQEFQALALDTVSEPEGKLGRSDSS